MVDGPDAARLRADYHRTLAELYEENFVAVFQRWAAERGVPFRIQSYGTPPAMVSSYRFADLFEGEGWGWTDLTQTRWASSAAHLYGRDSGLLGDLDLGALAVVPGDSARPQGRGARAPARRHQPVRRSRLAVLAGRRAGLGWFFYAAGALDDRNPWWPAMPELARYLSRLCWLLRQGEPVADVALYVPNDDLFATMGRAQGGSLDTWREANRRIPSAIPATIRTAGLDYDLIDDDALAITAPTRYRVVIVPTATRVPEATAAWIDRVRASGGVVMAVDSTLHLPGALEVTVDGLADALVEAVTPDLEVSPPTPDIGFVHRRRQNGEVYFVANTGPTTRTFGIVARSSLGSFEQWDAMSGRVLRAGAATEGIELTLHPYEATVVVLSDEPVEQVSAGTAPEHRQLLSGGWQVAYGNQPARPVELPHQWEDEPGRQHYSGAASYTTHVDVGDVDGRVWIDFGECEVHDEGSTEHGMVGPSYRVAVGSPVGEVAQVRVNGINCGLAWAPPYRVEIADALRSGSNEIEIIVYNTAANALAADEHITRLAAESEEQYGRRFRMQDLDQAMATVRSGLLRVPTLVRSPHTEPS